MKALPKRKGNPTPLSPEGRSVRASMKVYTSRYKTNGPTVIRGILICLIEIPYESVRKMRLFQQPRTVATFLNESPSNRKGKYAQK